MERESPLFPVVTYYNDSKSVLNQLMPLVELIVVDDGSTEGRQPCWICYSPEYGFRANPAKTRA